MINYFAKPIGDSTTCPQCGATTISVLVTTPPRCFRCLNCRHTWDEPYLRAVRDRRAAKADPA